MLAEAIRKQYEYNRWATERILNSAEGLTREEFIAPDDSSFSSIRNTLVHLVGVQQGWLAIWDGSAAEYGQEPYLAFEDFPDVDSIRSLWLMVEKQMDAFLLTLSDEDLTVIVTAEFEWGEMVAPLWEMMVHVVNHGTQHRSEAAVTLSKQGHSPGMMDFLYFSVSNPVTGKLTSLRSFDTSN